MHNALPPTMNPLPAEERALDPIEREAHAWVRRMASGRMTHADGRALSAWCKDPVRSAALGRARHQWDLLGEAGEVSLARMPAAPAATRPQQAVWQRRAFLAGGFGAAAAVATVAFVAPPLGLWPSAGELRADFRTGTGEQRRVVLSDEVTVQMNTRTSISVVSGANGASGIELIAGEAAIDMSNSRRPFEVTAGAARVTSEGARFELRLVHRDVCVTCLQGQVQVAHGGASVTLAERQQLTVGENPSGRVAQIDPADASAWREGFLRFRDTPLAEVVDEINRYRPGRVVVLDRQMAARAVTGRFRIDALDKAIAQIQRSLALPARSLPGGLLLLG